MLIQKGREEENEDEEVEWEQEFVFRPEDDLYELQMAGGLYMVVVSYPGIEPVSEHVHIDPLADANTELEIQLEEAQE